ncbi:unnamed protein product [Linum tenue]|uniref:Uncharacterized protein n=1 Tax=Linum tenue TaxID=586396 RepID=A0AAV0J3C5_9ROSI|nr:unnamed protein product [Linum tenue]
MALRRGAETSLRRLQERDWLPPRRLAYCVLDRAERGRQEERRARCAR